MAKKSSRTRAQKKRADYRKGGSVKRKHFDVGGDNANSTRWGSTTVGSSSSAGFDYSGTNTSNFMGDDTVTDLSQDYSGMLGGSTDEEVKDAALKAAMEKAAAKGATAAPVTDLSQSYSGMIGDPNYQAGEVSNKFAGQSGSSVGIGGEGFGAIEEPIVTGPVVSEIPTYTEADVDQAYIDLNAGTITAAELAKKYGVTEDYVNKNLADYNAKAAAAAAEAAEAAAQAKSAADVAAIPADADYTEFETQQVVDAINSGAMTVAQAAAQFGATEAQITAEVERRNQVAAGEKVTTADPFAEGVEAATKEALATKRKTNLDTATTEQLKDVDVGTKTWVKDDPKTKTIDESQAAGAFIKDYKRVDPDLLFDKRQSVDIAASTGITADADIQQLDAYKDITAPTGVGEQAFKEATAALTKAAEAGVVKPGNYDAFLTDLLNSPQFATDVNRPTISVDEIRQLSGGTTQAAQFSAGQVKAGLGQRTTDNFISDSSFIDKVGFRDDVNVSATPEAEKQTREAITGEPADSDAAKITDTIGYESFQRRTVTGIAAQDAAIKFTAEVANISSNLAQSIVQDPAKVTAQIDSEPPEVIAAIAALPPEALVSSQMETLLAGMESGNIPAWAKPAVDAVNQRLTQRGMDVSTVGRDALFNAVIQSALPMAQSNAQALQARAAQNLSNEQQANLQRAQTEANRRSNNLANRQTAESQTAQFSQNLKVLQSQFTQERDTLSFQQQQEQKVINLQNQQRTAELNAQNENASVAQNLGNSQQIELAELEIKNQTAQQNMSATNQERLVEMQVAADFISKNAAFDQQMKTANLSNDQQMKLANLTARNQADSESLSAAQQTELANLNTRMQTNITSANIAAQMGTALLSADQQRAVENASMVARMDLTKFSDAQQVELANSKFMQSVSLADFSARQQTVMQDATALASLDMATADQRTKLAITQAQNFLQRDMADLSNEQQALILDTQVEQQRLLSNQASSNAAKQFNATSDNQINQFNASLANQIEQFNSTQANAMAQFNAAEENRVSAINASNAIDASKFNNQIDLQVKTFNEQQDSQREQWNAANSQAIEQSNVSWRRQANTINTAAQNATNQENAAKAFQISAADQNFMWQELRDEAAYLRQAYENDEQRDTTLYATAISNDVGGKGATGISPILELIKNI